VKQNYLTKLLEYLKRFLGLLCFGSKRKIDIERREKAKEKEWN